MAGRPAGNTNVVARARAFELYAAGVRKTDIAASLNVTKASVSNWSKRDDWDGRLASLVNTAKQAAEHVTGEALAQAFIELQSKLPQRLRELDQLCGPSNHPSTRLNAIKSWVTLARDLEAKASVKATQPGTLQLIDDYANTAPAPQEEVPPVPAAGDTSPGDSTGHDHVPPPPSPSLPRHRPGGSSTPGDLYGSPA